MRKFNKFWRVRLLEYIFTQLAKKLPSSTFYYLKKMNSPKTKKICFKRISNSIIININVFIILSKRLEFLLTLGSPETWLNKTTVIYSGYNFLNLIFWALNWPWQAKMAWSTRPFPKKVICIFLIWDSLKQNLFRS